MTDYVRSATGRKLAVVKWITRDGGQSVVALAEDGNHYGVHRIVRPRRSKKKPYWVNGFDGGRWIVPYREDLPDPQGRLGKLLAEKRIGTRELQQEYARYLRLIEEYRDKPPPPPEGRQ